MTNEEINNTIDCLKEVHDLYDVMCGDWSFCWTAIEALEKQIPKKPTFTERTNKYNERLTDFWCPNCECEVDNDRDDWCSSCGQRLEWNND